MATDGLARRAGLACALALLLTAGCQERTGTVSGKVIFENKPLPGGTVTFAPTESGRFPKSSQIDELGNYEVSLTVGEYRIMVDNRELEPRSKAAGAPALPPGIKLPPGAKAPPANDESPAKQKRSGAGRYVAIPPKFYSGDSSELKYTVTAGSQPHDIELK